MIKFQYNRTSLGEVRKSLAMRQKALPTIKSKESALRVEVKRVRAAATDKEVELRRLLDEHDYMAALWGEFDAGIVEVEDVDIAQDKIAGVAIPVLERIRFRERPYDLFTSPVWFSQGVELLKRAATLGIEFEVLVRCSELLEASRKRTTQKVNLYEKVQIPGYQGAIIKIQRFLEDEENLSKSAQKIVKKKAAAGVI